MKRTAEMVRRSLVMHKNRYVRKGAYAAIVERRLISKEENK